MLKTRNKRLFYETNRNPGLYAKTYDLDDPELNDDIVVVEVPEHQITFRVTGNYPFNPPDMFYQQTQDGLKMVRALRITLDPIIQQHQLNFGCVCCQSVRNTWSPVYTMKTLLTEYLQLKERLQNVQHYHTIISPLFENNFVDTNVLQFF